MSIRVMSLVWDNSRAEGAALLVELALADWADDEGGNIYPSLIAIARKTRVSKRSVSYHLETLVGLGELSLRYKTHQHKSGDTTNDYKINVDYLRQLGPVSGQSKSDARCKPCNVENAIDVAKSARSTLQTLQPNPSVRDPSVKKESESASEGRVREISNLTFGEWKTTNSAAAIHRMLVSEGIRKIDDVMFKCWERDLRFVDLHDMREQWRTEYDASKGKLTQWPGFLTKRILVGDYPLRKTP